MVVGAPMYSETSSPELGRIFILYNNAVSAMACAQVCDISIKALRDNHSRGIEL